MTTDQQAAALLKITIADQDRLTPDRVEQVVKAFSQSQTSNKLAILRRFRQLLAQYQSRHTAVVTTAANLDTATKNNLQKSINNKYPHIQQIVWQEDPNLLGGFTILAGDMWYDSSITHDLEVIREQLSQ